MWNSKWKQEISLLITVIRGSAWVSYIVRSFRCVIISWFSRRTVRKSLGFIFKSSAALFSERSDPSSPFISLTDESLFLKVTFAKCRMTAITQYISARFSDMLRFNSLNIESSELKSYSGFPGSPQLVCDGKILKFF